MLRTENQYFWHCFEAFLAPEVQEPKLPSVSNRIQLCSDFPFVAKIDVYHKNLPYPETPKQIHIIEFIEVFRLLLLNPDVNVTVLHLCNKLNLSDC